jgi:hypothetical protein
VQLPNPWRQADDKQHPSPNHAAFNSIGLIPRPTVTGVTFVREYDHASIPRCRNFLTSPAIDNVCCHSTLYIATLCGASCNCICGPSKCTSDAEFTDTKPLAFAMDVSVKSIVTVLALSPL